MSGRHMARGRDFTESALLAGLWTLLHVQYALDHYDEPTLRRMIALILTNRASPASKDV